MKKMLYAVALSAMMAGSALAGETPLIDTQMDAVAAGYGSRDSSDCCDRTDISQRNYGDNSLNTNSGNTANGGQYVDNSRSGR